MEIIEDAWDFIIDGISEGWDFILEGADYVISFEWIEDIGEFFTGMFEDISEFSIIGLIFGICVVGLIYALRDYMINPFLKFMSPAEAFFWGIVTYIGCAVFGYLVGKSLFDRD